MLAALGATLAPFLGAIPGSIITRKNIGPWYQHIKKPSWRPPNWAFGPVWTCLVIIFGKLSRDYALLGQQKNCLAEIDTTVNSSLLQYGGMGYASYLVMRDGGDLVSLSLYCTQLALNWAWTPIFFGSHNVKAAFYEICLLWIAVAATGVNFFHVNKVNIDLKVLSS